MSDLDVIVVGAGVTGLCAALGAHEAGARRILIAESEDVVGGSSRLSGGMIMGAGTAMQRAQGIDDDGDSLFHDYLSLNQWQVDAGVVREFCENCGPTIDWLAEIGVEFREELVIGGEERLPRTHWVAGRGQGLVDTLHRQVRERDIDIALGQRVDRLLVDGGQVAGVSAGGEDLTADAVIITTGGFGANPERLGELYPQALHEDWTWYIGADGARGDGLDLGAEVGAQVVGQGRGLRLLHPNFVRTLEAYLPAWIVVVDCNGRRFYDESAPYGIVDGQHHAAGDRAFVIFDDVMLRHTEKWPSYKDKTMDGYMQTPNWNPIMVDEQVERGAMVAAATIDDLAAGLGLEAAVLSGTVATYNQAAADRVDRQFAKAGKFLHAIENPPFYGAEIRPATICLTSGGLRIDPDARVLDTTGLPIVGLFAAGETTGGVLGPRYMGSGNSLANCATMGRIAGARAVATTQGSAVAAMARE